MLVGRGCERVRWTIQRAKTKRSGQNLPSRQASAKSSTARVQAKQSLCAITGSRSRLLPRSVLLCSAQRCPPDTRTLSPQPTERTEKDIGSKSPETTTVSGFFCTIFQGAIQKISFPQKDLWGGLELVTVIKTQKSVTIHKKY